MNNNKAWTTSKIFIEWIQKFDAKMHQEKRKVSLLIDSCTAHPPNIPGLTNLSIPFLSANKTRKFTILEAMLMVTSAWKEVSSSSIKNFFCVAGVHKDLVVEQNSMDAELEINEDDITPEKGKVLLRIWMFLFKISTIVMNLF